MKKMLILIMLPVYLFSIELGISTSGKAITGDIWSEYNIDKKQGYYFKVLADFNKYENGEIVNVCADGSISGSSGSGTCSGHGGVSYAEPAKFTRYGIILGPTYWITESICFHTGVLMGIYSSNINVGDTTTKDFNRFGIDVGISYRTLRKDIPRIVLSYESERKQFFFGLSFPLYFRSYRKHIKEVE